MSSIPIVFSDQAHIEQIRKRLWCDREFGHAAVMIGAGFSRNSEKISQSTPAFPLWNDLSKSMQRSLNPGLPEEESVGMTALRLASEYEAVFGRPSLDTLIQQSIPDNDYIPGRLHKLLLSLPWSDVFTTNYDTLLERTRPAIHEKKYDLILTSPDIPGRMKPRIVKLHGSFPSHRPFIITEEDYRTYPNKFAPFVNMVQQSIMENAFCLIGFSGDDPNFLYWSGWVGDNLGSAALPIYLCGLLNLTMPQRRLLERRRIIPIDLSPLFSISDWPDNNLRHAKAIEWLLLNFMYGEPPNITSWPKPSKPSCASIWKKSDDLPDIPTGPQPLSPLGKSYPDSQPLKPEDFINLSKTWRRTRLEYPGWVITPQNNREILWSNTERWIHSILHNIEDISPPYNLFLLYELNWRLEKALVPLFMPWAEKIISILKTFNPYPKLIKIEGANIIPDRDEFKKFDWEFIGECWVELGFAISRVARENQDKSIFTFWMNLLEKLNQRREWQVRWFYESCLFNLFQFDREAIWKSLKSWPETKDLPFWEVKRASIFAELGELGEAEIIIEEALFKIRSRLQPFSIDYSLLSEEGWAMVLSSSIQFNKFKDMEEYAHYRDRWEKLAIYRCDPYQDIKPLKLVLNAPRPIRKAQKETKQEFDPGRVTETFHFSSLSIVSEFLPAFAFLRMIEEGALPIRCGNINMFSDAVVNSAKWIEPFSFLWSLSSMIRAGKIDEIKAWFDRVLVATLTQQEVLHLHNLLLSSLMQGIRYLAQKIELGDSEGALNYLNQFKLFIEMLSRLCFRLTKVQLNDIYNLIIDIYNKAMFRQRRHLYECVDILFQRVLYSLPQSELLIKIDQLLSLPIPTEGGFEVADLRRWVEPFQYIDWIEGTRLGSDFDRSSWSAPVSNLIRIIKDGTSDARQRAVTRIIKIININGLTTGEIEDFADALWSRVDPLKGLPSDTGLYDYAFLLLPEVKKGMAKQNFRKYLLSADFQRVVKRSISPEGKKSKSIAIGVREDRYIVEWLGGTVPFYPTEEEKKERLVDWTVDEAIQLFTKLVAWWDDEKDELRDESFEGLPFGGSLRERFSNLIPLLSQVILPRLGSADEKFKHKALELLTEMEQLDFCILSVLPMTLFIRPDSLNEVTLKLRHGINSITEVEVKGSIFGLNLWIAHSINQKLISAPNDLLDELVNTVATRRQPALDFAIERVSFIIDKMPEIMNDSQINSLCIGLEYLIKETELPNRVDRENITQLPQRIPINLRPDYRGASATLAYSLFNYFKNKNKEIPSVITEWERICKTDPLPEVRNAWR